MFRNFMNKTFFVTREITIFYSVKRHAGHSKWANIKHIKALKDAQKGNMFRKLGQSMKIAVIEGGSTDPNKNPKLEQVIQQAKRQNMPAASIASVLKSTQTDKSQCKNYILEIRGPGRSIIICEVFCDNLIQTKQTISTILKKCSSKYSDGGAKHMFEEKGIIIVDVPSSLLGKSSHDIMEIATEHAIESGCEDVQLLEDMLEFSCNSGNLSPVVSKLEKLEYKVTSASVEFIPHKLEELNEADLNTCVLLHEKLESHPAVVRIFDNVA